jgi:8-oxo-dGTP diphosphatase
MARSVEVRAAGGVVTRVGSDGRLELLIVHRPRYDDWSLPKGKALEGESDEACALREVEEETGLVCALGAEVAVSEYEDGADARNAFATSR